MTQTVLYTEGYATEEARNGNTQKVSDVFSFGVVLREAVTGTKWAGADAHWFAVRDGKFDVHGIGNQLIATLVADCVQLNPAARPKIDVVLERFKSIDPESLLVKNVESTGTRTIRFREGDDPAICRFKAKDSQTVADDMEEAGLKGRLRDDEGFAVACRTRIGKLDLSVIYVLR